MQKKWKRFWALLLCLSMLGAMAFAVHAEEPAEESEEQVEAAGEELGELITVNDECFDGIQCSEEETALELQEETFEENGEQEEMIAEVEALTVEEGTCEHSFYYDPNIYFQPESKGHYAVCAICRTVTCVPHTPDENGFCTDCGYDVEERPEFCKHVFYYSKVNNNLEHVGKCSICGFTTEPQAHSCVFDKELIRPYNPGQTVFDTSHIAFCTDCFGCVSLPHTPDEKGVCTGCGYEVKETSDGDCIHLWQAFPWSASGKGHTLKCLRCDLKIEEDCAWEHPEGDPGWGADIQSGEALHGINCTVCGNYATEKHTYDANMICTVCGYAEHEHVRYYYPNKPIGAYGQEFVFDGIIDKRSAFHYAVCSICEEKGFRDNYYIENHVWENGACAQCGYPQHEHDDHYNPNPTCCYNLHNGHVNTCSICNESVYAPHIWVNGICSVCGFEQGHICDFSVGYSVNAWWHNFRCAKCGGVGSQYHEMDGEGHCLVCDYVDDSYHTHSGTEVPGHDATCTATGLTTVYSCTCGKLFKDAACTVETEAAEVIPVKDHDWKDATCTAPMTCSVCGTTVGTSAAHTPGQWHQNENGHWNFCTVCEAKLAEAAHADSNADHVCDTCGFEMPEEAHVHSYRYDGKTKDKDGHTMTCPCGDSHKDAHTRNALGRCSVCGYSITTTAKVTEAVRTVVTTVVNRILSILFRPRG